MAALVAVNQGIVDSVRLYETDEEADKALNQFCEANNIYRNEAGDIEDEDWDVVIIEPSDPNEF